MSKPDITIDRVPETSMHTLDDGCPCNPTISNEDTPGVGPARIRQHHELSPSEWLDQPVRITRDGVYFGEHQLPGIIAENGVTLQTNIDGTDINKLTVELLVGAVKVDDPAVTETLAAPGKRFGVRRPASEPDNPYADLKCSHISPPTGGLLPNDGRMLCEREHNHSGEHTHGDRRWRNFGSGETTDV